MNDTRKTDEYTRLAPDVDRAWVEEFVLEQRLLGVHGEQIGDALALVQSHLTETGEDVEEAFGPAARYAREAAPARRVDDVDRGWLLGVGLGLVGMLVTTAGARSWLFGDGTLEVTVGLAVITALAVAAYLVLARRSEWVLRLALEHIWLTVVANVLGTALLVVLALQLRAPLADVPAAVVTGVGIALLLVSTVLEWRTHAAGGLEDPITGPGEAAPPSSGGVLGWLTVFLFPVLTVLMVGLSWALELLA